MAALSLLFCSLALLPQGAPCPLTPAGCEACIPLTQELDGDYIGEPRGLYPGRTNEPPAWMLSLIDDELLEIVPRDAAGQPVEDGLIGFAAFTYSNVNQEFSVFERNADKTPTRNGRVAIMNLARGGQAVDVIDLGTEHYWGEVDARVTASGVHPNQVQVAWLKISSINVIQAPFPMSAELLATDAKAVARNLRQRFPNLRVLYLSSRIYGGYGTKASFPHEPDSYETGFAVRKLIERQQNGDIELEWRNGEVPAEAPLMLWGPYLWANGATPNLDGLAWETEDLECDGTHPSQLGEAKVAGILRDFLQESPLARSWYAEPGDLRTVVLDATDDASVIDGDGQNFGLEGNLRLGPGNKAFVRFDVSGVEGEIVHAKLSLLVAAVQATISPQTHAFGVSDTGWDEATLNGINQPAVDGADYGVLPNLSRGTATTFDVTAEVLGAPGGVLSLALICNTLPQGESDWFLSKEGNGAPRLVLSVRPTCETPGVQFCSNPENSLGERAVLRAAGSACIESNALNLVATGLPALQAVQYFVGLETGFTALGQGFVCVGSPQLFLSPVITSDAQGTAVYSPDWSAPPFSSFPGLVGSTLYFQSSYDDGGGTALTSGVAVVPCLCP